MSFCTGSFKASPLAGERFGEGSKINFATFQIPFDIYFNPSN
jgi:hypothetical protein